MIDDQQNTCPKCGEMLRRDDDKTHKMRVMACWKCGYRRYLGYEHADRRREADRPWGHQKGQANERGKVGAYSRRKQQKEVAA